MKTRMNAFQRNIHNLSLIRAATMSRKSHYYSEKLSLASSNSCGWGISNEVLAPRALRTLQGQQDGKVTENQEGVTRRGTVDEELEEEEEEHLDSTRSDSQPEVILSGTRDTDRTVCHNCRQGLSPRQFHSDKAAENDVLAIEVACPNFDCTWSGTLKSYQEHVCPSAAQCGSAKESALVLRDQEVVKEKKVAWSNKNTSVDNSSLNTEAVLLRVESLELMVVSLRRQLNSQVATVKSLQRCCSQYEKIMKTSQEMLENSCRAKEPVATSSELISTDGTLVWKVENFSKLLRNATCGKKRSVYSPVFATHAFGYRLCVRMYPDGDGIGKGSHLSLFLALAQGPYDDVLPWPFQQKVTFFLLDPTQKKSPLKETFLPDPHSTSFHQPHERLNVASGSPLFATKAQIPGYLKDDVLYLKVVVDLAGMNV
ncbi:TNF receptor-associated factor 1-like [Sphaerodactylus townsendi]|uniref:TNF receptor-associated factor 1-like n=1 Tax=Sphaerodactylus townsendi TaxID=933632 RepID=UPI0020267FB7|nr:TNF receptor-associated factor 1-like [Sphaerodactylus townsendi]